MLHPFLSKYKSEFGFLVILGYLSILNLYYLRSTPEVLFVQFTFLAFIFFAGRFTQFVRYWIPFIAAFVFFEFARGVADNANPFTSKLELVIYNLEKFLFPILPTSWLQSHIASTSPIVTVLFFFYGMFFYYSFLVAFILWASKDLSTFKTYFIRFIAMSLFSCLLFFSLPTSPPWLVAQTQPLNVTRYIYDSHLLKDMAGLSIYGHFVYGNPKAAFPSLHTAWPVFTSIFLITRYKKHIFYLTLIIPIMISLSVITTGEHFVIDVIAGWLLGVIFVKMNLNKSTKSENRNSKQIQNNKS